MSQAAARSGIKQATFLGHPIGLYILFFTEMWERFSYYGMRGLLVLYMLNYLRMEQKEASSIYKIYTSLVYVTPILGGYLADRFLGNKRAVIIGAILMAIGHFLMAFEAFSIFLSALIFLILGNGFFKPNMSTQVGRLYPTNDGRLDGAYTIFYMGINLGAFLAPLACGWLAANTVGGYHSGFTMAGIGMVCGLLIYLVGQPWVRELADRPIEGPSAVPPATPTTTGQPPLAPPSEGVKAAGPVEVRQDSTKADPPVSRPITEEMVPDVKKTDALTEAEAARQPSVFGGLIRLASPALYVVAALLFLGGAYEMVRLFLPAVTDPQHFNLYDAIREAFNPAMMGLGGSLCLFINGFVMDKVRGGLKDRVLAILVLGFFVMIFWLAAEQAGNVLSVWADKNTDQYITEPLKAATVEETDPTETPEQAKAEGGVVSQSLMERFRNMFRLKPPAPEKAGAPAKEEKTWTQWLLSSLNPMAPVYFQSINPLAIFILAPLFTYLWFKLDKMGIQPSIPMKMVLGMALMSLSVVVMIGAARQEGQETVVAVQGDGLPTGTALTVEKSVVVPAWWDPFGLKEETKTSEHGFVGQKEKEKFVPFDASLLTYDEQKKELHAQGVLPDTVRDVIIGATAPESFIKAVKELVKESQKIGDKEDGKEIKLVEKKLEPVPPGFNMKWSGVTPDTVKFDAEKGTLIARKKLEDREEKGLLVAAGEPKFRATMHELYIKSNTHRVSSWWLFWSYILVTIGELCLSPVGLSMVSKLSPAKYATMMMGLWLLTSAFGNFAAGALGEDWGTTAPIPFFIRLTIIAVAGTLLLVILVRVVTKMMHGVK